MMPSMFEYMRDWLASGQQGLPPMPSFTSSNSHNALVSPAAAVVSPSAAAVSPTAAAASPAVAAAVSPAADAGGVLGCGCVGDLGGGHGGCVPGYGRVGDPSGCVCDPDGGTSIGA